MIHETQSERLPEPKPIGAGAADEFDDDDYDERDECPDCGYQNCRCGDEHYWGGPPSFNRGPVDDLGPSSLRGMVPEHVIEATRVARRYRRQNKRELYETAAIRAGARIEAMRYTQNKLANRARFPAHCPRCLLIGECKQVIDSGGGDIPF